VVVERVRVHEAASAPRDARSRAESRQGKWRDEGMMDATRRSIVLAGVAATVIGFGTHAHAASAASINRDVSAALKMLYAQNAGAQVLASKAKAVLVFPRIVKAGFMFGAQGGDGALRERGKTVGYYRTLAASYGFQAGIQSFGYALFFMSDSALSYLRRSEGWEIGTGPSVVIVDQGMARQLSTTTLKDDVYAVVFDQKGLMAGMGIQGSKITQITPR